jgi:hypothetical protein
MSEYREHDMMVCRACGKPDRASEGYPCEVCGTFICLVCTMRGVTRCRKCAAASPAPGDPRGGERGEGPR